MRALRAAPGQGQLPGHSRGEGHGGLLVNPYHLYAAGNSEDGKIIVNDVGRGRDRVEMFSVLCF